MALQIRAYRGSSDLRGMAEVINRRMDAEGGEDHATVESLAQQYAHLHNCDPARDIRVAEEDGVVVGYARTVWELLDTGERQYWVIAESDPERPEVLAQLYDWVEQRAAEVAASHPSGVKYLIMWAPETSTRAEVLKQRGFVGFRYSAEMVRPSLDDIPETSLPSNVEMRPVEDSHLRQIWEADAEAFRDAWGSSERSEADWESFLDDPNWDPSLWRVAWSGDEVVGQVRNYIDAIENERFGRKRGYTENISTARAWRGRGIARALICASLRALSDAGMEEAALSVDLESPTGAPHLYASLGYLQTGLEGLYRRPLPA